MASIVGPTRGGGGGRSGRGSVGGGIAVVVVGVVVVEGVLPVNVNVDTWSYGPLVLDLRSIRVSVCVVRGPVSWFFLVIVMLLTFGNRSSSVYFFGTSKVEGCIISC